MTTIRKASGHTPDGNHVWDVPDGEAVPAWDPDAIARMYAEAKANIADEAGVWAHDAEEPWPATEAIDLRTMTPPEAFRASSVEADPASSRNEPETTDGHLVAESPEGPVAPPGTWRRWFSRR